MKQNNILKLALLIVSTIFYFHASAIITPNDSQKREDSKFIDKILPAPKGCGFIDKDYWIWGSSVIKGDDGKYHMFASRWPRKLGFGNWVTNSEVVHAISDTPAGVYKFHDIVLPTRGNQYWDGMCTHNPRIVKYKNKYLLYYFGTTYDFKKPDTNGNTIPKGGWKQAWANKRIGVAISDNLYGPWKRLDRPIIEPRKGHWDATITSNPAPAVNEKNGKILLMYKSSETFDNPNLLIGVAEADNPEGPYKRLSDKPIFNFKSKDGKIVDVEDPYIWWQNNRYEGVIKDRSGCLCGESGAGLHIWSKDGVHWKICKDKKAYSKTIKWDDGTTTVQNHFERPFVLIENGVPTHMFMATGSGTKEWSFDKTWNMVMPLKH